MGAIVVADQPKEPDDSQHNNCLSRRRSGFRRRGMSPGLFQRLRHLAFRSRRAHQLSRRLTVDQLRRTASTEGATPTGTPRNREDAQFHPRW